MEVRWEVRWRMVTVIHRNDDAEKTANLGQALAPTTINCTSLGLGVGVESGKMRLFI